MLLGWSLGLSLFLELLSALAMLQGSHFLLLIHLSRAKSESLELFYHIEGVQKMQRKARNDKKRGRGQAPPLQINVEEMTLF